MSLRSPTTRSGAAGSVWCRGLGRCGGTCRSRLRRGWRDRGLFGRVCRFNQLIVDVIFVDVTHISHWFLADPRCRHPLDIVEPQVRVELFRLRFAPQRLDFAWPRVIRGESKQVAVLVVEYCIVEIVIHQLRHVFGARMDVGVRLVDVADAEFAAGLRHYLHQANRTDGADGALVKTRFLLTLRHQHQGIEPVFAGVVPENLDCVAKALQVDVLGGGVQLLELCQVGPRLIRPPIHISVIAVIARLSVANSFGLSGRTAQAISAPSRNDAFGCSLRPLIICTQSSATQSSPTVAGNNPAAVISIRSATSSVSGTIVMVTGGLPWAVSRSFSFVRPS